MTLPVSVSLLTVLTPNLDGSTKINAETGKDHVLFLPEGQEIQRWCAGTPNSCEAFLMGITHCPICIGLAVLSATRFMAHCVMAFQLERGRAGCSTHPATLQGVVFEI